MDTAREDTARRGGISKPVRGADRIARELAEDRGIIKWARHHSHQACNDRVRTVGTRLHSAVMVLVGACNFRWPDLVGGR